MIILAVCGSALCVSGTRTRINEFFHRSLEDLSLIEFLGQLIKTNDDSVNVLIKNKYYKFLYCITKSDTDEILKTLKTLKTIDHTIWRLNIKMKK